MIPAGEWNEMLARWRRNRIVSITERRGSNWRHPWFTTCTWNPELLRWEAVVKPGFVWNGRQADVTASVELRTAGSREIRRVDVPLTDAPSIALTAFRAVGTDDVGFGDSPPEQVPKYFLQRGVKDGTRFGADSLEAEGLASFETALEGEEAEEARILRACDLVLHHDRLGTAISWQLGTGLDGQFAQFNVGVSSPPNGRPGAYLRAVSKHEDLPPLDEANRLLGDYPVTTSDAERVCTIYLLSPPGAALDSAPDATWTPHVQYRLWWNLCYFTRGPELARAPENMQFSLAGLGAIAGVQNTVNLLLAERNDALNNALQFLTARETTGRFWSV